MSDQKRLMMAAAMFADMPDIRGLADHYQPRSVAYSLRNMAGKPDKRAKVKGARKQKNRTRHE
jgi:hypothetical protein